MAEVIQKMTEAEKQERADCLYQQARDIIDREWLAAGISREQLAQSEQLADLMDILVGTGRTVDSILSEWEGKTPEEILRDNASLIEVVSLQERL
jgi:hypothetical protein